jgi:hypothetical protein
MKDQQTMVRRQHHNVCVAARVPRGLHNAHAARIATALVKVGAQCGIDGQRDGRLGRGR